MKQRRDASKGDRTRPKAGLREQRFGTLASPQRNPAPLPIQIWNLLRSLLLRRHPERGATWPTAMSAFAAAAGSRPTPLASFDLQVSIEKFSASREQNPETFVRVIESAQGLYGWSDAQTMAYAGLNLKGRALDWYNNLEPMSWTSFKTALTNRFGTDPSKMLGALTKRVQGETEGVRDYADALRTLVRHSRDPHLPSTLQHFFINGLREDLQRFVKTRRPQTFEAAITEGEYYEAEFGGTAGRVAAGSKEATAAPPLPSAPSGRVLRERNAGDPVEYVRRRLEKLSVQLHDITGSLALLHAPNPADYDATVCFHNCDEPDPWADDALPPTVPAGYLELNSDDEWHSQPEIDTPDAPDDNEMDEYPSSAELPTSSGEGGSVV